MVRFNDKTQIDSLANNDIMPITDMSDTADDRKVTVQQLSQFAVDNIPTLSGGKTLTDNNLTNDLKDNYDTAYANQDLTKYDATISYPKGYWVTNIDSGQKVIKESLIDDNLGNPLTDNTKWKSVNFGDEESINSKITNCILEAPNGVATYSGSTITIKGGLKGLASDGRNTDGTLLNVEKTVVSDISFNTLGVDNAYTIFIRGDNAELIRCPLQSYFIGGERPTSTSTANGVYRDEEENKFYYTVTSGTSWEEMPMFHVLTYTEENGVITVFNPSQSVELCTTNTDQVITGSKIFQDDNSAYGSYDRTVFKNAGFVGITLQSTVIDKTQPASSSKFHGIEIKDKNGERLVYLGAKQGDDGVTNIVLQNNAGNNGGFSFPKCTTKPTTVSTASDLKVAVVIQNYISGNSWYRVWSDGWCEQGGIIKGNEANKTITFMKPYKNLPIINVHVYGYYNQGLLDVGANFKYITPQTVTLKNFKVFSSNYGTCWEARGYIK